MRLSRRAAEFINPTSAHSLALRNAVLALAPRHPFAKVMINTGRLSVAPNLRGSVLLTPDMESWDTSITPGNAAVDAPVTSQRGEDDWLIHHLTGDFQLLFYAGPDGAIAPEVQTALDALAQDPVPVGAIVVSGARGQAAGLHDAKDLIRKRYDLTPGSAYLFRPDQHVAARWRILRADEVRNAVRRSLGERA
jgi:3-(3-hydroxy-phenyl)propionate hydroxylase